MNEETRKKTSPEEDAQEEQEWLESYAAIIRRRGPERARRILDLLDETAFREGVPHPFTANTPYVNSIPREKQPRYPGNRELERRIKSIIRWNAMAMVVRANRESPGIGGHISTYASAATLLEVGFNHFFRARSGNDSGDHVYFQGHSSPGIYARAFLEGRLTEEHLRNFRRELRSPRSLSSYPHPRLMPDFWQFPTVSMGLGPLLAIYQARFNRYLADRGLKDTARSKIWCFIGDGETDEPESLGSISLAAREKLDNLIFVINCNLQRLDGPVRGNGKIIQELEAIFRGAGWNVLKVIWGDDWDPLLARDQNGLLLRRMSECVDGDYQKYTVSPGAYIRDHFFGKYPEVLKLVANHSDEQLRKMRRGGHDPEKVFAAFQAAVETIGKPTVILAKTVKGYGLGEAGEGRNITHQQKKLNESELREFRSRFGIPISDDEVGAAPFYRPPENSPEIRYLRERRQTLGGMLPARATETPKLPPATTTLFEEFYQGTDGREVSTTMAFVRLLGKLLRDKNLGRLVVPIVPDEARTFGMETLFRQFGIYSHAGQLYEPVDADTLLYYKESRDGQILEEGITEAGGLSSFIAAGTAYATHGVPMIPFFIYYSMFGLQRVGDLIWAAADMRAKGFLVGATAGRTTLAGEGLQHQDGQSHLLALPVPSLRSYDPAFAFEIAVIMRDGLKRMYVDGEDLFYYLTVGNENYAMPPMPAGAEEGILRGLYLFKPTAQPQAPLRAQLFGSGALLNEVLKAQTLLAEKFDVAADVWSVTSWKEPHREALATERWNLLHPEERPKTSRLAELLRDAPGVFTAVSDYVRAVPDALSRWFPKKPVILGTDGFGRSDDRQALRNFFEVDFRWIAFATLQALAEEGKIPKAVTIEALKTLELDPNKKNPLDD